MEDKITIFPEDVLAKVSVNYRFMCQEETSQVKELRQDVRFSVSRLHRTFQYMNYALYKPLSSIFMDKNLITIPSHEDES